MKNKFLLLFITCFLVCPIKSSIAGVLHFSGTLYNNSGQPVISPTNINFRIYQMPNAGTTLWEESHTNILPDSGLISVILGNSTPLNNNIFTESTNYLGIQIEGSPEMLPRLQLAYSPSSFLSEIARSLIGIDIHSCQSNDIISRNINNDGWQCSNNPAQMGYITSETDPKIGSILEGMWCIGEQSRINCNIAAPILTELDPKIGTLSSQKWCSSDGLQINCLSSPPVLVELDPKIGSTSENKWCSSDGVKINCIQPQPLIIESDPKVGQLVNGKWCSSDGSKINCNNIKPITTEEDPKIGSLNEGKWCVTNNNKIQCNETPPIMNELDPTITTLAPGGWCVSNGTKISCDYSAPCCAEDDPEVGINYQNYLSKWDGNSLVSGNIYDNGNIGVGTNDPLHKLHIYGGNEESFCVENSDGAKMTSTGYRLIFSGNDDSTIDKLGGGIYFLESLILSQQELY